MKSIVMMVCALLSLCLCRPCAAETDTRCFELRIYYAMPDKLEALEARFRDHTCKLFEKHGLENIGYWVPQENPENKLIYVIAGPSRAAHDTSWKAFIDDPEWKKVKEASEVNGKLVAKVDSVFLAATDFSPPSRRPARGRVFLNCGPTPRPRASWTRCKRVCRSHAGAVLQARHDACRLLDPHGRGEQPAHLRAGAREQGSRGHVVCEFRQVLAWDAAKKASEVNGVLVEKVDSVFMQPLDFSPIK